MHEVEEVTVDDLRGRVADHVLDARVHVADGATPVDDDEQVTDARQHRGESCLAGAQRLAGTTATEVVRERIRHLLNGVHLVT